MSFDPVLDQVLSPLARHYSDPAIVEIRMKQPGVVLVEHRKEGKITVDDKALNLHTLERVCRGLANHNALQFDPENNPKLSTVLPEGHRFECVMGSSPRNGVSLNIRTKHKFDVTWNDWSVEGDLYEYISEVMNQKLNFLLSGSTNTGKTTFLNQLLKFWPDSVRVISVEDTPELDVERFYDGVSLIASRDENGKDALLTYRQIADHLKRATPDSILFGEISTTNAFAALDALNTGVTGFGSTIHAESPHKAIHRKFDQNITFAGQKMEQVGQYLSELIDVVIQLNRDENYKRRISDIYEPKNDRYLIKNFQITDQLGVALADLRKRKQQ